MKKAILVLIIALLLTACRAMTTPVPTPTNEGEWRCRPLPETFQEPDLIGTWQVSHEAATSTDMIILREDGTYRQMYEKSNGRRYESSWNRWQVERRPGGGLYVHLEGMRYCDSIDEDCERHEGGGGDWLFYDFCEDRVLKMRGEVILAIVGTEGSRHPVLKTAPRGIALMHMRSDLDSGSSFFVLKK